MVSTYWFLRHISKQNRKSTTGILYATISDLLNLLALVQYRTMVLAWIGPWPLGTTRDQYKILDCTRDQSKLVPRWYRFWNGKMGCVFPIIVVSILLHTKFGPNDHRVDTPHFIRGQEVNGKAQRNFLKSRTRPYNVKSLWSMSAAWIWWMFYV